MATLQEFSRSSREVHFGQVMGSNPIGSTTIESVGVKYGSRAFATGVLRQNSMRTENSAIPCHDSCLIQVISSPSNA